MKSPAGADEPNTVIPSPEMLENTMHTRIPQVYPGPASESPPPRRRRADTRPKAQQIGRNIQAARIARKLSQQDVIDQLGHGTKSWLSRVENGHQLITLSILEEIAGILDMPLETLNAATPAFTIPDPAIYGPRVRELREKAGLSHEDVIADLGYGNVRWLRTLEAGKTRPPRTKLEELAEVLGTSIETLLDPTSETSTNSTTPNPRST